MKCKKCDSDRAVKSGFVKGEQRYQCKDCGCQFVPTRAHGRAKKDKTLAVWLYLHGLSFRTIAKLFKVTPKAIYDWVKKYAQENYVKPVPQGELVVIELDEMWHYLQSKKPNSGFGRLIVAIPINSSTGRSEGVTMLHLQDFTGD
jgi:transposase-like protein